MISQSFSEYISQFETDGSNLYGSSYIITEEEILPDFDTLSKVVTTVVGTYSTKQDYKDRNMIATSSANYSGEVGIFKNKIEKNKNANNTTNKEEKSRIRVITDTDRETRIAILNDIFIAINSLSCYQENQENKDSVTSTSGTSQYNFKHRGTASGTTSRTFNNIIIEVKPLHAETSFTMKDYLGEYKEGNYNFTNAKDLRDRMYDSIEHNEKLKSKESYIKQLFTTFDALKNDPENIKYKTELKNLMQNKSFISFGEIFIPYLLLQRKECPFVNEFIKVVPEQTIIEIKFPNTANNSVYDYTVVSEKNGKQVNSNFAFNKDKIEEFEARLKGYNIKNLERAVDNFATTTTDVSAKYGEGHKQEITRILRNSYSDLSKEERGYYEGKGITFYEFAKFLSTEGSNRPAYLNIIKFTIDSFFDVDENDKKELYELFEHYGNTGNIEGLNKDKNKDIVEKFLEKNKGILNLNKDTENLIKDKFPSSFTYLCGKILENAGQTEDNKNLLKKMIGCVDYYQVRINDKKTDNIEDVCEVVHINKESDFEVFFRILNGTGDLKNFKMQRGACLGVGVEKIDKNKKTTTTKNTNSDSNNSDSNNSDKNKNFGIVKYKLPDTSNKENDNFQTVDSKTNDIKNNNTETTASGTKSKNNKNTEDEEYLRKTIEDILIEKYGYEKGEISDEMIDEIINDVKNNKNQNQK